MNVKLSGLALHRAGGSALQEHPPPNQELSSAKMYAGGKGITSFKTEGLNNKARACEKMPGEV